MASIWPSPTTCAILRIRESVWGTSFNNATSVPSRWCYRFPTVPWESSNNPTQIALVAHIGNILPRLSFSSCAVGSPPSHFVVDSPVRLVESFLYDPPAGLGPPSHSPNCLRHLGAF
ncbi:unnamed protein product [Soboliphyme baturini]|uniref:Secreted protein n=1 Tax=Soboliphyme baturini TaxID=241478 RepID=A0A183J3C8_9BILA|nr:unnamed protein product [Soboliphyme baturini]